jgi:D-threo-aldose 1-dehydrogenase
VLPGARRPARVAEDQLALQADTPPAFWHALREPGLVALDAPLPIDAQGA